MCADNGADVGNEGDLSAGFFLNYIGEQLCVLLTVTVGNPDRGFVENGCHETVGKGGKRCPSASCGSYFGKVSLVINVENRFYAEQTANKGNGRRNSAAAL